MRLFTQNGHDWTQRYPLIVEAALRNRTSRFVLDGEAVLLGVDGISDFNGLHSRQHNEEVQLYAFDTLAIEGEDFRELPLDIERTTSRAAESAGHFRGAVRTGGDRAGPVPQGLRVQLEGMVSKRRDSLYRAGNSPNWIKVKNRHHPAMYRVKERDGLKRKRPATFRPPGDLQGVRLSYGFRRIRSLPPLIAEMSRDFRNTC